MTEENHCYENAMAKRVNGILKDEFYLDKPLIVSLTHRELQKTQLIYKMK
jgi:hypothetical protein